MAADETDDGGFVYLFEEHVTADEADGGGFVFLSSLTTRCRL